MSKRQILPEAFYDSLSLARKLDEYLDGFREDEIHLFAYFSMLLFLYKKNSLSDWRYQFTSSEGYPFSQDVDECIRMHIRNGNIEYYSNFLKITARGADEFNQFKNMELFKKREKFLSAACTASIAIPYSLTQKALKNEPRLDHARQMNDKRWIIPDGQSSVYEDFAAISNKIGIDMDDLLIPAVTWINLLIEQTEVKENGNKIDR